MYLKIKEKEQMYWTGVGGSWIFYSVRKLKEMPDEQIVYLTFGDTVSSL